MGCDIHIAVEKKVRDGWVMVDRLHYQTNKDACNRNYRRFAKLAGVRGDGPEPKGLPADISESADLYVEEWEGDAHSHSWLPAEEAAKIFLETEYEHEERSDYRKKYPLEHYFGIDDEKSSDYRIVFFFDN